MKYIIVLALCALATSKMSLQSSFGKKFVSSTADALCFNALIFLFSAIVFLYEIIDCPWQIWVYAALGSACAVIYQMTYTKALAMGNVSLTALIVNLALVINVLASYVFYNDSISHLRLIGILLTLVTFFLCIEPKASKSKKEIKWVFLSVVAMLSSSAGHIVQKVLGESRFCSYNGAYTSASYLISAILAYLMYRTLKSKGESKTFPIGKTAIFYSALIGIILATYIMLNIYALSVVEGTFLFPAYSGGTIILSAITGVIFFKDKLNSRQMLGIITGIVAVILMNF